MSKVWVVRAGDDIEHQKFALANGCVVINFEAMGGSFESLDTPDKAKAAVQSDASIPKDLNNHQIFAWWVAML